MKLLTVELVDTRQVVVQYSGNCSAMAKANMNNWAGKRVKMMMNRKDYRRNHALFDHCNLDELEVMDLKRVAIALKMVHPDIHRHLLLRNNQLKMVPLMVNKVTVTAIDWVAWMANNWR